MLKKPDEVLGRHIRALVFLLICEILLLSILNLAIQSQAKLAVPFNKEQW